MPRGGKSLRTVRIERELFGFRVTLDSRHVEVELDPWRLRVRSAGSSDEDFDVASATMLNDAILERLDPPTRGPLRRLTPSRWSISKGVQRYHRDLLRRVPRQVYRVHERVRREPAMRSSALHTRAEFFERRHLVSDVLKYRAAAIAVSSAQELCPPNSPWLYVEASLDLLESWLDLFSPDGRAYGSLRRSLMNLAPSVPAYMLPLLRRFRLPRPITDSLELTTLCTALFEQRRGFHHVDVWEGRLRILAHANATEIEEGVGRVLVHTHRHDDLDSVTAITAFIRFLDFPESHAGRLGGLVEKAIRWHVRVNGRNFEPLLELADLPVELRSLDTPTARPRFPIPDDRRICFLDTVGSVLREGQEMGHCVATRAGAAVRGTAHLFHVEMNGEKATVQLNRAGRVVEAAGPGNSDNQAVRWAVELFADWIRDAEEASGEAASFDELRGRFHGQGWLKIAENLHTRVGGTEDNP